jgi:hypothetical protein
VINRSPQYKNKYVHRRTSVSLENLSSSQVQRRNATFVAFFVREICFNCSGGLLRLVCQWFS